MNQDAHLLYVEDDETLSFVTKDNLEQHGFIVDHAIHGVQGLEKFKQSSYDLCILDVMLPEMDGFELAEKIRTINPQIPILFLTAKSLKEDRIRGLRIGGDDYITKPFSIEELILKIEIFLKRKYIDKALPELISLGGYTYDHQNLELKHPEYSKTLTQKEGDLLMMLINNRDKVLRRGTILESLWGEDDYFLGRSMDVFISRLRKHLKQDEGIKIENIHGVGFKLTAK